GLSVSRPAHVRRAQSARLAERLGIRADSPRGERLRRAARDLCRAALIARAPGDAEARAELVCRDRRGEGLQLAVVGVARGCAGELRPAGLLSGVEEEESEAAGTLGRQPGANLIRGDDYEHEFETSRHDCGASYGLRF